MTAQLVVTWRMTGLGTLTLKRHDLLKNNPRECDFHFSPSELAPIKLRQCAVEPHQRIDRFELQNLRRAIRFHQSCEQSPPNGMTRKGTVFLFDTTRLMFLSVSI